MGHNEVVSTLVRARAGVNIQNRFGNTALHKAASNGHLDVVATLIKAGADIKIRNKGGKTATPVAENDEIARQVFIIYPLKRIFYTNDIIISL